MLSTLKERTTRRMLATQEEKGKATRMANITITDIRRGLGVVRTVKTNKKQNENEVIITNNTSTYLCSYYYLIKQKEVKHSEYSIHKIRQYITEDLPIYQEKGEFFSFLFHAEDHYQ